jgi:hypothetical protein
MRKTFDLDKQTLDSFNVLVYGVPNTGKTYFLGDALREERKVGAVKFLNIAGEDGSLTLSGMGLGDVGEHIDTAQDLKDFVAQWSKTPLQALAVDSLLALSAKVIQARVGDRLPSLKGEGNEWGDVHWAMASLVSSLRTCAKYVICTAPADREQDPIKGTKYIAPMLPGRQAREILGRFDFVGYMAATILNKKARWTLSFAPSEEVATRQRVPSPLLNEIVIPQGGGGWAAFKSAITDTFKGA